MARQGLRQDLRRPSPPTTLDPSLRNLEASSGSVACSSAQTSHGGFTASHVFLAAPGLVESETRHHCVSGFQVLSFHD